MMARKKTGAQVNIRKRTWKPERGQRVQLLPHTGIPEMAGFVIVIVVAIVLIAVAVHG
jgi:UDP-N-acetylmuramyl pentapeptide phosphotransferase/UDP-N-acetylglucosamine-1-phosphate transferase